ncbi:MAG: o-succinylbenzoate--CoA ligase [Ignavibacteriaceae bacterium]
MHFRIENLIDLKSHPGSNTTVIAKDSTKSYSELDKLSDSFAEYISDNISKKEFVGIYLDNSIEFIISVISLWKLGAVPVPLNLIAAEDELLKLISIPTIKTIITDKIHSQKINHPGTVDIIPIDLQKLNFKKPSQRFIISDFNDNDEAVVIFTSGSTGGPKGVVHTFHSLLSSIVNGNEILNHNNDDRWLASLPFYHIGGFQIFCRTLYYGISIIIPESLQTNHLAQAISEFQPTHASFVSTQLKRLLDNNIKPNSELRCSLIGGGFIDKDMLLNAKKSGWHPVKVYGSSETASFVCALSENDIEEKAVSTGKPVGNNQIMIVDENGNECSAKTEGEIIIKSDSLFKYYLNNESGTKDGLKQDNYFTGDLGYLENDGFLFVTGRKNDMIVTGGKNVNPLEVETAILKYPSIIEAAVFPVDDVEWGEIVCAAVVSSKKIDSNELKLFLKNTLSSYKVPKKIFIESSLPKTTLGKIEKKNLKIKYS